MAIPPRSSSSSRPANGGFAASLPPEPTRPLNAKRGAACLATPRSYCLSSGALLAAESVRLNGDLVASRQAGSRHDRGCGPARRRAGLRGQDRKPVQLRATGRADFHATSEDELSSSARGRGAHQGSGGGVVCPCGQISVHEGAAGGTSRTGGTRRTLRPGCASRTSCAGVALVALGSGGAVARRCRPWLRWCRWLRRRPGLRRCRWCRRRPVSPVSPLSPLTPWMPWMP